MLHQLLLILAAGGTHYLQQLARQLDTSEELLASMMGELVRMGYLEPLHARCGGHCPSCSRANGCGIGSGGRVWALTASGKKIAHH